ncbi:MAG: hypothetical protein HC814_08685, partial [Rhodobacteraceae bacterium]|nr:hypothetical protein [Paracoccaceae bacterium]
VVGPKDLPRVLRTVSHFVRKARGLAREFQSGVAEMVREADLDDIKRKVEGSSRTIESTFKETVDPTGSLTSDFDPAEFNRQIKERVEGGPPTRPMAAEAAPEGGKPSEASPATEKPPAAKPKSEAENAPGRQAGRGLTLLESRSHATSRWLKR